MKKFLIVCILLLFLITGCGKKSNKEVIDGFSKKVQNLDAYNINGTLKIINGEDTYEYDVTSSYKKDNLFKVELKNKINNHVKILLKNNDGVYVLTPSLNKSFKFQSEWPYNNSQIYLLQSLLNDINNDSEKKIENKDNKYVISTKVNYSNNNNLKNQKVYLSQSYDLEKVEIYDENNNLQMIMEVSNIDYKANFNDEYFLLNNNINVEENKETFSPSSKIDSIIYPMYLPANTHLISQDTVSIDKGERVIMTFDGDSPFMLIQETAVLNKDLMTTPVYGEPENICGSIGAVSDSSVTWLSNGIEYYLTSNVVNQSELVQIAQSIGTIPVGK